MTGCSRPSPDGLPCHGRLTTLVLHFPYAQGLIAGAFADISNIPYMGISKYRMAAMFGLRSFTYAL